MLNEDELKDKEPFIPETDMMQFILRWYKAYDEDRQLKEEPYDCINGKILGNFWQSSRNDYNNLVPNKRKADWKKSMVRGITRDKANGFIAKLASKLITSQVLAQNKNQKIDQVMCRMFGILLDWWLRMCKARRNFIDIVQTAVIDGTVHVQQLVINGKEVREIIPNDEVFVPNFKQCDVQKQSHFIRVTIASYEETKLLWGDNERWKHVMPGASDKWGIDNEELQGYESGIKNDDEVMIMYVWEHGGYDKDNNLKKKPYNVFISGIPMYDIDYKMPLKHNRFPEKGIFEKFADVKFYWGNSLPNKISNDKKYLDAYRTIVLNKAILNLGTPLFNRGQEYIDEDVIVPFKITPTQLEEKDIFPVPGVSNPITQGDLNIEEIVERSIDEATQPPASLGGEAGRGATLGEIQLKDARASELLKTFGQMISFLVEDMDTQSLSNIMQFETMQNMKKLVDGTELLMSTEIEIPDQTLKDGSKGTLSLRIGDKKGFPKEIDVAQDELDTKKEIIYADYNYIKDLDKYVFVSANPVDKPSEALERLIAIENYKSVYYQNPFIDQVEATRNVVRANKDPEDKLVKEPQPVEQQQLGAGGETPPTQRMKQSVMPKTQANMPAV